MLILITLLLIFAGNSFANNPPDGVSPQQWQSVKQQIAASKYFPQVDKSGFYTAHNAAQGWQLQYAADGMTTLKNTDYRIGMKLQSIGSYRVNSAPDIEIKENTLFYHHSPTIKEWWTNTADKTEQWFGISNRPITGSYELKVNIELDTDTTVSQAGDQLIFTAQQGQNINYDKLKVWDSRGNILPSRMQLAKNHDSFALIVDDRLATYPITIDPSFSQDSYIKPAVTDTNDWFGYSVDIDGDIMVVGTLLEDSASQLINGDSSDNSAVSAGAAYVFALIGIDWVQQAYLKASNAEAGDSFGRSVAVSGSTVVVGASAEDGDANSTMNSPNNNSSGSGAAYVFTRSGSTWTQQAYLKAFNVGDFDLFGTSVAIDGNTIVVGAISDDGDAGSTMDLPNENAFSAGAVHVFTRIGTTWTQEGYLKASNAEVNDKLGSSVAIDGNTVVAGAFGEDGDANSSINAPNNAAIDAGAAYVFVRDVTSWSQQGYLKAHNAEANDQFSNDTGNAVAVDGDTVVVGSYKEDGDASSSINSPNNNAVDAGAAYVFVRDDTIWNQQSYLKASNAELDDSFAFSVDIAGETIVVGARREDGDLNSSLEFPNNNSTLSGAAYVFSRNNSDWQLKGYLKGENTHHFDSFGRSVAINEGNIIVGSTGEDGDANSTIVTPNDNTIDAGAVYLFKGMYYIGGNVLGLPFGGPLELFLNGSEILSVTNNGAYEFPTDVTLNSSYTVSISSVPAGYTCSIINASGSVGYDDVTDANIFCSTSSYSVGGSVTGLTGTGLVLRNNGVYDVIINSNGGFAFTPDFANGTPYDVVVLTQPNNGQTCSISNGSGTITGGDTNISVVCVGADYNIGGTVSGLTGTLILQNNNSDDLTLTSNGSFTFTSPITDGNPYAVSVLSQPNGQTCTIDNANGTVAGADVTNVQVTCTTNTYFIGGSSSGLAAAGLVLQNNGSDDLTITSNGSFVFTSPITDGNIYAVSILSQPNGQSCTIDNANGTVSGADVTNVQITCTVNTYFIGGAVSGLTAAGLVLQNNGGDDLNIISNGGYVFSQPLVDHSNYTVSVSSQPNNQNCTVINASGTIAGNDVVNVGINCTDSTYIIGVSVAGLTGTGLVLQNNGGDDLSINDNGTIPFSTQLDNGSSYNVTIFSQPNDLNTICQISGPNSGIVVGEHVLLPVVCANEIMFVDGFE